MALLFLGENEKDSSMKDKINFMDNRNEIMRQLIEYAHEKMEKNNAYPFCAFIVKDGEIISKGCNVRAIAYGDITMHGEMEAMKKASKALHTGVFLNGYELWSVCKPCLACFDSALWCGIRYFVYSVDNADFPDYFHDHPYDIENYVKDNPKEIVVVKNLLHEEGIKLFKTAKEKYGW